MGKLFLNIQNYGTFTYGKLVALFFCKSISVIPHFLTH
jgi:hypothetical protein